MKKILLGSALVFGIVVVPLAAQHRGGTGIGMAGGMGRIRGMGIGSGRTRGSMASTARQRNEQRKDQKQTQNQAQNQAQNRNRTTRTQGAQQ